MKEIIECVPNFSEGRNEEVIEEILASIKKVDGVKIWDVLVDKDHNRTVVTFIGDKDAVKKAALDSAYTAAKLIDMSKHKGAHPRVGAVDVIPFVPLFNSSIETCIELANEVGEEISKNLNIPVYNYGQAAKRESLKDLGYIQNIQYENLFEKIKEEAYAPDYGKSEMNEKLGASLVGARNILVAFNVNLGTDNLKIAKEIAKKIRYSSGGLRYVKAMGLKLEERKLTQVSMDMGNYEKTAMYQAFEMIKMEAKRYGVEIVESEIIGLLPMDAMFDTTQYYFKAHTFKKDQVIEKKLLDEFI